MSKTPAYLNIVPIVLIFLCAGLFSCQKELDPDGYRTCLPESISVYENNSATVSELYSYVYDPSTLWPKTITISIPASAFTRIFDVTVDGNTISLGSDGFIEMDASKRITHLAVKRAYPGAEKGDYFYGYNSEGFLAERLFDDGASMVERAIFTHDGTAIDSFTMTYEFDPDTFSGSLNYQPAAGGSGENVLPYTDIFPELLPFSYLVKIGRLSLDVPASMKVIFESPSLPSAVTINYGYSGYQFDADKLLTAFSSLLTIPGIPDYKRRFSISYVCK